MWPLFPFILFLSVAIQGLIESAIHIDATKFLTSDLFNCLPHCYKHLLRLKKLSNNFHWLKGEIKKDFDKGGLQTKWLRKDSTAEESLAAPIQRLQQSNPVSNVSHVESSCHLSAQSGTAKSLKFPAIQPTLCSLLRLIRTTCTSLSDQGTVEGPVGGFPVLCFSSSAIAILCYDASGTTCLRNHHRNQVMMRLLWHL